MRKSTFQIPMDYCQWVFSMMAEYSLSGSLHFTKMAAVSNSLPQGNSLLNVNSPGVAPLASPTPWGKMK